MAADGTISVTNHGWYVARFSVGYTQDGQRKEQSSGNFTLGFSRQISIPANATDIFVLVEDAVFIEKWRPVCCFNFAAPETHSYTMGGTTFNPTWS